MQNIHWNPCYMFIWYMISQSSESEINRDTVFSSLYLVRLPRAHVCTFSYLIQNLINKKNSVRIRYARTGIFCWCGFVCQKQGKWEVSPRRKNSLLIQLTLLQGENDSNEILPDLYLLKPLTLSQLLKILQIN